MTLRTFLGVAVAMVCFPTTAAQTQPVTQPARVQNLRDIRMRDVCILAN